MTESAENHKFSFAELAKKLRYLADHPEILRQWADEAEQLFENTLLT